MKKKFSASFFLMMFVISISARAQNMSSGTHAFFTASETEIKNEVKAGSLVFYVSGLETEQQADDFLKRSKPYSKGFSMTLGAQVNGQRECKIIFNGNPEMKWALRFFLASGIADVKQDNSVKTVNDFFKPYL